MCGRLLGEETVIWECVCGLELILAGVDSMHGSRASYSRPFL